MPMGERIGAHIIKSKHYLVLIPAVFMIGALITVAEPDLQVLADQFETLNRWAVILTVAAGVGSFLVLALVRIIKNSAYADSACTLCACFRRCRHNGN